MIVDHVVEELATVPLDVIQKNAALAMTLDTKVMTDGRPRQLLATFYLNTR